MRIGIKKFNEADIKWIVKIFIIWNIINFLFDLTGCVIMKIITDYPELYSVGFSDSLYRLLFQAILFTIPLCITYYLTNHKLFSLYSFVIIHSLIFHLIYLNNLNVDEDGISRIYTDWNNGILYLMNMWPRILDIVNNYWPLGGLFEDGVFIPESTQYFYLLWIVLPLLYNLMITYFTDLIENRKLLFSMKSIFDSID